MEFPHSFCISSTSQLLHYFFSLAKELFIYLSSISSKGERKGFHFVQRDQGSVQVLQEHCRAHDVIVSFECKRQTYFLQLGLNCENTTTVFCRGHA